MNPKYFMQQVERLKEVFGAENLNKEKLPLIWSEVRDLSDRDFKTMVDVYIGENSASYPPKVSWFREQAHEVRKRIRIQEATAAAANWNKNQTSRQGQNGGLEKALKDAGANSLLDAIFKKHGG